MSLQRHHFGFFMIVLCVFLVFVFAGLWEVVSRVQIADNPWLVDKDREQDQDLDRDRERDRDRDRYRERETYCDPRPC